MEGVASPGGDLTRDAQEEEETEYAEMDDVWTTNDSIYGMIELPKFLQVFIDSEVFQRMRDIKQTGIMEYVYNGAYHTRFVHSVGTSYLAYQLLKQVEAQLVPLQKKYRKDGKARGLDERAIDRMLPRLRHIDLLCITLAALLHDVGHPAFSHMFEDFMNHGRDASKRPRWSHETASRLLCDYLFEQKRADMLTAGFTDRDRQFIRELIDPPKRELHAAMAQGRLAERWPELIGGRPERRDAWMYEIVSNWRSGIDVDRMDYFGRDSKHMGVPQIFDVKRYLSNVKLEFYNEDVAVKDWVAPSNIWTLAVMSKDVETMRRTFFQQRAELHRVGYQHKTVKKVESTMLSIMRKIASIMKIVNKDGEEVSLIEAASLEDFDPDAYLKLTDSLVIAQLANVKKPNGSSTAAEKTMWEASEEFKFRIMNRNLMRQVEKITMMFHEKDKDLCEKAEKQLEMVKEIIASARHDQGLVARYPCPEFGEKDIDNLMVTFTDLHQGSKEKDPLSNVLIVTKTGQKRCAGASDDQLELLLQEYQNGLGEKACEAYKMYKHRKMDGHLFWSPPLQMDQSTKRYRAKFSKEEENQILERLNAAAMAFWTRRHEVDEAEDCACAAHAAVVEGSGLSGSSQEDDDRARKRSLARDASGALLRMSPQKKQRVLSSSPTIPEGVAVEMPAPQAAQQAAESKPKRTRSRVLGRESSALDTEGSQFELYQKSRKAGTSGHSK